jgi:hypothetical protein
MDIYEIRKLIKDKNTPFSEIEKGIKLLSSSEKAVSGLCDRTDVPQYVLEWLAMTADSKSDLIAIFVKHPHLLNLCGYKNDAYGRSILLQRIASHRGLGKYLGNLLTIYSKNWK